MECAQTIDTAAPATGDGVFRPRPLVFRPDRMLRVHGYRDMAKIRPAIRKAADDIAALVERLVTPEVHYRRLSTRSLVGGRLTLENGVAFTNEAFEHHLGASREVVVAIATLGRGLDDEVIKMMDRFEPLEALLMETAGWLGIEQTSKQFGDFLRATARRQGLCVSCRMGPGYSYRIGEREVRWSLEDQRQIFAVFADADLPVRLLESCAMLPKMSRSSIYGLAPMN